MGQGRKLSVSKVALAAAIALGASLCALHVHAATATTNLGVTATITNSCTITSAPVAFGPYDPVSTNAAAAVDLNGTVSVACTDGATSTITLGQGANAGDGSSDAAPVRRMTDGVNFLSYALFQNGARTTVWGNTELTGVTHSGIGTPVAITVFGRLAAGQNVPAGAYTDTVVATITF